MYLILIEIGAVAGWKRGAVEASAYLILAFGPAILAGLWLLLQLAGPSAALIDPIGIASGWIVAFFYMAVPCALLAWLKVKRIENRCE